MGNTLEKIIRYANKELITNSKLDVVDKVFSDEYVVHHGRKKYTGHKCILRWVKQLGSAMPDLKVTKIEILNQSKNTITWLRTLKGTHDKKLRGILPSNKSVEWREMVVSNFEGDKIIEEWVSSELLGCMLLNVPCK